MATLLMIITTAAVVAIDRIRVPARGAL